MQQIFVLGGGAAGLAAAIAAAQSGALVTVLERNARAGKKLLATGNGRCNLDNLAISPEKYFSSSPSALSPLLRTVEQAAPLAWLEALGLYPRADEAGRIYPYSNQAADVLALLEAQLARYGVQMRTGCTVRSIAQKRGGYAVNFTRADGTAETAYAGAVICALGGAAGPQFGTDGFGVRFASACGGRVQPVYPCLTALQCAPARKELAGIRAKAAASLFDGTRVLAREEGEVQFAEYGLSGICIMQLSCYLRPNGGPKAPAVELDLFPAISEEQLAALFAARAPALPGVCETFWLGLLHPALGRALWAAAGLPGGPVGERTARDWQILAHTTKHWRFEGLRPCGWKHAQVTGGGLALDEIEPESFAFKGCPGLYFVGETLDCTGGCGGYNLHFAFGSGIAAGRAAATYVIKKH